MAILTKSLVRQRAAGISIQFFLKKILVGNPVIHITVIVKSVQMIFMTVGVDLYLP